MEYYVNIFEMRGEMIETIGTHVHYVQNDALEEIDDFNGYCDQVYMHTIHVDGDKATIEDLRPMLAELLQERADDRRHEAICRTSLRESQI